MIGLSRNFDMYRLMFCHFNNIMYQLVVEVPVIDLSKMSNEVLINVCLNIDKLDKSIHCCLVVQRVICSILPLIYFMSMIFNLTVLDNIRQLCATKRRFFAKFWNFGNFLSVDNFKPRIRHFEKLSKSYWKEIVEFSCLQNTIHYAQKIELIGWMQNECWV